MYQRIPLYRRNGDIASYAIVDADDFARLNAFRWSRHSKNYAVRWEGRRPILMHRVVLGTDAAEVDHVNRDGLDNRRVNLRAATHAENMQNRRPHRNNTSGYRGVMFDARSRRWCGQIKRDGRKVWRRYFDDKFTAAAATAAARRELLPYATT